MEKNVTKITLSTFFLILAIIVIVLMGVFIYKLNNDKTSEIQKSTELQGQVNSLKETIIDLQSKTNKVSYVLTENENKANNDTHLEINKIILDELKERRFLAKNNIDIDSKVRYISINNNGNPIYIVHVAHERDEFNQMSTYFFITYIDGKVTFNKALENKSEYELFYEEKSITIKAEEIKKGYERTIYGTAKDGKFVQTDDFSQPTGGDPESQKYMLNGKEVSVDDFINLKEKYNNLNFISFSENAKEL